MDRESGDSASVQAVEGCDPVVVHDCPVGGTQTDQVLQFLGTQLIVEHQVYVSSQPGDLVQGGQVREAGTWLEAVHVVVDIVVVLAQY